MAGLESGDLSTAANAARDWAAAQAENFFLIFLGCLRASPIEHSKEVSLNELQCIRRSVSGAVHEGEHIGERLDDATLLQITDETFFV